MTGHLDKLHRFLEAPLAIVCPSMKILTKDFEPDLLVGKGELVVEPQGHFTYRITGKPIDLGHSLRALNRQRDNPYDNLARFRLEFTDEQGTAWSAGWTVPKVSFKDDLWVLQGRCQSLTSDIIDGVEGQGGAEARFLIPSTFPEMPLLLRSMQCKGQPGCLSREIDVLGNRVRFNFDVERQVLAISTPSSLAFPPHATENWLGEPLRVLFGQPVYPRLVERRFPDGRSMLWVRPVPRWSTDSRWTALWNDSSAFDDSFFENYAGLLTIVARDGGWEANPLTEFYDHLIAVADGPRWVIALTLSSSIEGLVRMLVPRDALRPDADKAAIHSLVEHIQKWSGASRLKDLAVSAAGRADSLSVPAILRSFAKSGLGTQEQVASWLKIRNSVMHGELISPYSSEEDDRILLHLSELLHTLTIELIVRSKRDPYGTAS